MARNHALDALVDDLARAQHGAFTLAQVHGLADRRLAAARVDVGEWRRFAAGTFVLPSRVDRWTDCAALCLHVPAAVMAGTAAGWWWALDGVPDEAASLVVPPSCGVRHPMLRRAGDLLRWEARNEADGCLRMTDPTRTIIDLAASLDANELERTVEAALRRGLTSEPRLRLRSSQLRGPGRRGPARSSPCSTVVRRADPRTATARCCSSNCCATPGCPFRSGSTRWAATASTWSGPGIGSRWSSTAPAIVRRSSSIATT